ncbi:sigma-70 family RNA polymerase sigma factor [bacterium]|nr:sigma-70 family RNA polymerase sigma factor [bacterium]
MFNRALKKNAGTGSFETVEFPDSESKGLETLYSRYHHLVLGICLKYLKNREDARDAVTEICQKLAVESRKHEIRSFKSWLYIVARNHCFEILRKKQRQTFVDLEEARGDTNFMEFPDDMHPNDEQWTDEKIHEAVGLLKNGQKKCIRLFYLEEKSYREVAEITGFDLKQVKSHIQNGRQNLKRLLTQIPETDYAR